MRPAELPAPGFPRLLRKLAPFSLVAGAVASEICMFRVGHRNQSVVLMLLFAGWVLSPFAACALLYRKAKSWSTATQAVLHGLMLLLVVVSLAVYARPPDRQPASVFLLIPGVFWFLVSLVLPIAIKLR